MAAFLKDLQKDLQTTLATVDATIVVRLGAWEQYRNEPPPRVVLVPSRDRFEGVLGRVPVGTAEPAPLLSNSAGIEVHIWGKPSDPATDPDYSFGYTETEELRDLFVSALVDSVGQGYTADGGYWIGGEMDAGKVYVLNISVGTPINDILNIHPTVEVLAETAAISITGGDGETVNISLP